MASHVSDVSPKIRRQTQVPKDPHGHQALPVPRRAQVGGCIQARKSHGVLYSCPLQGYTRQDLQDMSALWQIEWGDIFHDFADMDSSDMVADTPGQVEGFLTWRETDDDFAFKLPCDVCLPDVTVLQRYSNDLDAKSDCSSRALPKPSSRVLEFLCNSQCPQRCCTLFCPWNSMGDSLMDPHGIVKLFGSPCFCKSYQCRKCLQQKLLQRFTDPDPSSLVSAPRATLMSPSLGLALYGGVGEPVFDSSTARYEPKLYRLTCVPWRTSLAGGCLPQWLQRPSFHQLSLTEFLDANGFNRQANYRQRDISSYSEYLRPVRENYVADALPIKCYGQARKFWSPGSALLWNASIIKGDDDDCAATSGWEWRWEEDEETWTQSFIKMNGSWEHPRDALSADRDQHAEWVELFDGRLVSTRCSFCTFLHGAPSREAVPSNTSEICSVSHPGLPEDMALHTAQFVVRLRGLVDNVDEVLHPRDVINAAERFASLLPILQGFRQTPSMCQARLLLRAWAGIGDNAPGFASAFEDFQQHSLVQLLEGYQGVLAEFERRVEDAKRVHTSAIEGWRLNGPSGYSSTQRAHLTTSTHFSELDGSRIQQVLQRNNFQSPIFALVDGSAAALKPRFTRCSTDDCCCNVPWHQRAPWERQPWIAYELPVPPTMWQACWEESQQCVVWRLSNQEGLDPAGCQVSQDVPIASRLAVVENNDSLNTSALPAFGSTAFESGRRKFKNYSSEILSEGFSDIAADHASQERVNFASAIREVHTSASAFGKSGSQSYDSGPGDAIAFCSSDEEELRQGIFHNGADGEEEKEEDEEQEMVQESHDSGSNSGSQHSEPLDVDDPEGYFECPQTLPRKRIGVSYNCGQTGEKEDRFCEMHRELARTSSVVQVIAPVFGSAVPHREDAPYKQNKRSHFVDNASGDSASDEETVYMAYCNESERD